MLITPPPPKLIGVEGTGSYGAGLTRHLHAEGVRVVEVDRANRQNRRRRDKSDTVDAARAALSGDAHGEAKTRTGNVESMRVLRLVKLSARKAKTMALNQMRSIVATGPEVLRRDMRDLPAARLVEHAAALRPGRVLDPLTSTKLALRQLARRIQGFDAEIAEINTLIEPLVTATAPELLAYHGVGPDVAAALLVAAGSNRNDRDLSAPSLTSAASHRSTRRQANRNGIGSAARATDKRTQPCGESS